MVVVNIIQLIFLCCFKVVARMRVLYISARRVRGMRACGNGYEFVDSRWQFTLWSKSLTLFNALRDL